MKSVPALLTASPLFSRLDPPVLERLAADVRPRHVAAGEIIFREGEPCEGFYIVVSGSVRVYKLAPDGRERTLHTMRPPHAFAEAALFGSGVYPAFAEAVEDSEVLLVPRQPFLRLLRQEPESALRVFESLSMWLHRLLDQLETEAFLSARAKLASYIVREVQRQSGRTPFVLQLTQAKKAVAAQLGMAPETFSRAQADLESRGLIQVNGRNISVYDLDALQEVMLGDLP